MNAPSFTRSRQTGAYLLEALIGILIFSIGVLGIVGLQAASLRATTDSGLRAEAVFAANQLLGQMWADDEQNLVANYSSALAGAQYVEFKKNLLNAQKGAWVADPAVVFDRIAPPSTTSHYVEIVIQWKTCKTSACTQSDVDIHNYSTSAVIGQN